jgi:hypothetical protein
VCNVFHLHVLYLESKTKLEEINKEINHYDEQLNIIERERVKLMSELALQMQMKVKIRLHDFITFIIIVFFFLFIFYNLKNCEIGKYW